MIEWVKRNKMQVIFGLFSVLSTFVLVMSYYHLWGRDIRVPIAGYRGDSVGMLLEASNYVRGGNIHSATIFSAPHNGGYRGALGDYAMMLPTIRLFWKITGSVEAAINMQLIFSHIILGLCMYIVCIRLELSERMALVASVLVPNTSFLILGYNVIMMSYVYCFYLPFFAYYVIKMMMADEDEQEDGGFAGVLFLMLFMFIAGVNSLYYTFFCLIVLAFVGVYALVRLRSVKKVLLVILSYLSMGYGLAVCLMPDILHAMGMGWIWESGIYYILTTAVGAIVVGLVYLFYRKVYPGMTMKKIVLTLLGLGVVLAMGIFVIARYTNFMGQYEGRTLYAVELGALNITNLFLPAPNNIIAGLDQMVAVLTDIDNPEMCDATEMGVLTGIGLIYSMLSMFRFHRTEDKRVRIAGICGMCSSVMILVAAKGGLASVIAAYITTGIRNYNRMAIIIMIFSMIAFGIMIDRAMEKIREISAKPWRFSVTGILWAGILAGMMISIPTHYIYNHNFGVLHYDQRKAEYDEWYALIEGIEEISGEGDMILELPTAIEDIGPLMTNGRAYELSIPAIISEKTIWSYAGGMATEFDVVEDTEQYIAEAVESGFKGIYLDTLLYGDTSYTQCIDALKKCLGEPDVSDGQRRYFWKF